MTTPHENTQQHSGYLHTHTRLETYFNVQVLPGNVFLPEPPTFVVKERSSPQQLPQSGCLFPGTEQFYQNLQEDAHSPAA